MTPAARAPRLGLVLSGGGARAAYQVGAIRALAEISRGRQTPFSILAGVSAGAINAVALASHADDFRASAERLWATWSAITPDRVYRTDIWSLGRIGSRWLEELTLGGLFAGHINHLLDTSPLRGFLEQELDFAAVERNLGRGSLRGVAVSATNYHTGTAITFYATEPRPAPPIEPWMRSMRLGQSARLRMDHVLASCAIPIFFPPVQIDGSYFGDGCVRLNSPLSPAVHLGAEGIIAIGVRCLRSAQTTGELNHPDQLASPALSEIGGVLLNAVFLDSLESDAELLERTNGTIARLAPAERERLRPPLRQIPILVLRPSQDLGLLAVRQHQHFPRALRYLLRGIGVTHERGADLLSYLAFAPEYIGRLLELGRADTLARRAEVESFFEASRASLGENAPPRPHEAAPRK